MSYFYSHETISELIDTETLHNYCFCYDLHNTVLPFYVEVFFQSLTKLLKIPLATAITSIKLLWLNLILQTCQLWYFLEKISTRLHQLPQSLYVLHILTPRSVNRLPRSQHFRPWQLPCFRYFAMIITYEYRCNKSLTNYLGRLLQKTKGQWSSLHNISSQISHVIMNFVLFL